MQKTQVLKWARENSCPWDEEVCASAASGGHLALLKYCWANRCPWNEYTCELAAEGGHLEVLKWARSKGCPWDEDVCAFAAEEGHMEVSLKGLCEYAPPRNLYGFDQGHGKGGVPLFSLVCLSQSHEWLCISRMKMV